jgi:hypothetical protein
VGEEVIPTHEALLGSVFLFFGLFYFGFGLGLFDFRWVILDLRWIILDLLVVFLGFRRLVHASRLIFRG